MDKKVGTSYTEYSVYSNPDVLSICLWFREFKMRNQEDLAKKVAKGTTENDNKDKEEDNSTKVDESAFDSQKVISMGETIK